jgi:hypothetical protein
MASNTVIVPIERKGEDKNLLLTLSFNGGPITVLVDEPSKARQIYTFSADPFFRRNNHYIATGSLSLHPDGTGEIIIVASFSNMFPKDAQPTPNPQFDLNLYLQSNPTIPGKAKNGVVNVNETNHIVFKISK